MVKIPTANKIIERDGFRCKYCGCPLDAETYTIDHIKPISIGGGDDESNLALSCRSCNSSKGALIPDSIEQIREMIGVTYSADSDAYPFRVSKRPRSRGNRGNRKAQMQRYRLKYPEKYRNYMREYMRARRKSLICNAI